MKYIETYNLPLTKNKRIDNMTMTKKTIILFFIYINIAPNSLSAQQTITSDQAVQLALKNNFTIQQLETAKAIAKNNTSKYNTGKLPTVSLNGGVAYRLDNASTKFQNGDKATVSFAESYSGNATASVGYTLYDGSFRKHNIAQLQEQYTLSELQINTAAQNIAAQTRTSYYQIASLVQNIAVLNEAIEISKQRLNRATQQFEYGQGSRLDVLNAEVDMNNDSLNYINAIIQLENAKRQLNNLMIEIKTLNYDVNTDNTYISNMDYGALKKEMFNNNPDIRIAENNIRIGDLSIDLANARKRPTVGASLSYGYNYSNNNAASFVASQTNNGLNAGLNVQWNIFDGGSTRTAVENAQLNAQNFRIQKNQTLLDLEYAFDNAWANYQNQLFIAETQEKNVAINRTNFERTREKFTIGQVNSVDFRQAQLNLQNAEINANSARFQVKIAEVELLRLAGRLL